MMWKCITRLKCECSDKTSRFEGVCSEEYFKADFILTYSTFDIPFLLDEYWIYQALPWERKHFELRICLPQHLVTGLFNIV